MSDHHGTLGLVGQRQGRVAGDVLIIGAGVTGLLIAARLHARGIDVTVLEARQRLGGRALTVDRDGSLVNAATRACFDLGATWIWSDQPRIQRLLNELGITIFPQHEDGKVLRDQGPGRPPRVEDLPAKDIVTLRFTGGALGLCQRLAACLPRDCLHLGHEVRSITTDADSGVRTAIVSADGEGSFVARCVVVTLPPQLAVTSLRFSPELPRDVQAAMAATPTWMGKAMKCVVCYQSAFWREQGLAGIATSDHGPVKAFHDATTDDGRHPALFGFFSDDPAIRARDPEARKALVLDQMTRLYGPDAARPLAYLEHDWSRERFTVRPEHRAIDADAPDGDPLLRQPLWDGRLYLAGTETAAHGAGYLEGAVESADETARQISGYAVATESGPATPYRAR